MQELWLNGPGHLLITDAQGRRLGYAGSEFVSEIPGAYESPVDGGLGVEEEPIYRLPVQDGYTILLDGQTVARPDDVTISQFGPGYAVQIANDHMQPNSRDNITIAADGLEIFYQPGEDRKPTLTLAIDHDNASYQLSVADADIAGGDRVTVTAHDIAGHLTYSHATGGGGSYGLVVRRASSSGMSLFAHGALAVASSNTHYAAFGSWNGQGSMTLLIDHDSNGSIDETITLENQIRITHMPMMTEE